MSDQPHTILRRQDHEITDQQTLRALLTKALVGRLGVIANGEPYIVPMNFVYDEGAPGSLGRIILHGANSGRMISALREQAEICFEIDEFLATLPDPVLCDYDTAYLSVICTGQARIIETLTERTLALRILSHKYALPEEAEALKEKTVEAYRGKQNSHTAVIEITLTSMTGKTQGVIPPAHVVAEQARKKADLEGLGEVAEGYQHHQRLVTIGSDFSAPGLHLKWYELRRGEVIIPREMIQASRTLLKEEAERGAFVAKSNGLGFVVLHYSDTTAYLIVCTWYDNQELWQTVYTRDLTHASGFEKISGTSPSPAFCVWEMAPVWHERQAWTRYLYSKRDEAAKQAYLQDRLTGLI